MHSSSPVWNCDKLHMSEQHFTTLSSSQGMHRCRCQAGQLAVLMADHSTLPVTSNQITRHDTACIKTWDAVRG
jgi:hypothetical protein